MTVNLLYRKYGTIAVSGKIERQILLSEGIYMTKETFVALTKLNRLSLSETEEAKVMEFFAELEKGEESLCNVVTEGLDVMVHLNDLSNILRDDVEVKEYTRDELQEHAPESYDGYWQVPRLVD